MFIYQIPLTLYALLLVIVMGTKRTTLKQKLAPKEEKNRLLFESSESRETLSAAISREADRQSAYLPGDIRPIHYDIQYTFGMEVMTVEKLASWKGYPFYGVVSIKIKALKSTSTITLHAHDKSFTVEKNRTNVMDGETFLPISSIQQLEEFSSDQLLNINLKKKLIESKVYTVVIPFNGTLLDDSNKGMILMSNDKSIIDKDSFRVYAEFYLIVASQPDGARRVFPCFDEPQYKATFSLTVGHHNNFSTVLSNMPLQETMTKNPMEEYWTWDLMNQRFKANLSDFSWEQFEKSPPMSTYLLTFSITNFTYIESPAGYTRTPIRTYTTFDAIHQAEHVSLITPKILEYYEHYWNMSYHLPKLDLVLVDFEPKSFESWGHIYLDVSSVLFDPKSDYLEIKLVGTSLISIELAYQFFGNLVTPKSYGDTWLSDGFAMYFAIKAIREVAFPEFDERIELSVFATWHYFTLDKQKRHALSSPVDPSNMAIDDNPINGQYGLIIVRMLHEYVGENVCREVLQKYLTKYSYDNVDKDNLWAIFDEDEEVQRILGENVTMRKLMDPWVTIADYPVLTVTRNYGQNTLTLRQQPHDDCPTIDGIDVCQNFTEKKTSHINTEARSYHDKLSWWLPLNMMVQVQQGDITGTKKWLTDSEGVDTEFSMEHSAKDDQWVIFNAGLIAPYRVNYDAANWKLLIRELQQSEQSSSIPDLSREQLLADGQVFGKLDVHYATISTVGDILKNLRPRHFISHSASLEAFEHINQKMARTPEYETYQRHMANLIRPTYDRLGGIQGHKQRSKHDILQQNMQMRVSTWSCQLKIPGCEEKALEMFQQWRQTKHPDKENPIPIHARQTSVCVALSRDAAANMEFVGERVRHARSYAERRYLLAALACSNDTRILTRLLEWSIADDSEISTSDASWLITSIASKPTAFEAAKSFLYSRTADIISRFRRNKRWYLKDFIANIIKNISTQNELDEFLYWRKSNGHSLGEFDYVIDLALKTATRNVEWMQKHKNKFVRKLRMGA